MIINKLLLKLFGICFFVSTAIQKSNYNYLGCFLGDNLLSLGDERHNSSFISPKSCSELCSKKNYTFFFLKNDTCYCNKNYISILMKQFDSDCMIPCLGDNSSSCGSLNSVSSYITDSLKLDDFKKHGGYPIPIYVGCYAENISNGKNRLLKGIHRKSSTNTPQKCSEICFNMGYLYFGVTEGSGCLCGNQQPSKSSKIDDTNCNQPCSGDNNQFCGGEWKILGIYSTGITDHVPRKYVGCLDDDENKSEDKYLSYEMGNNNSPRRCMNLCNTQRFKYAAIKSNVCECRNYEPKFSLKRRDHDCITVCKENPSERCGGGTLVVSIYRTLYPEPRKNIVVNHIGCFNNLNMYPVLNGWKIMMSQLTSKRCVHNCFARMFPYAALISAHECLCSYIKPFNGAKTDGNNICTIPCSGSSEQSCGSDNAINVYSTGLELNTDAIGNYYLGCYENSRNKRVFNGSIQYFSANTPEFCSNYCYKNGYPYSGVSQKSECYCGFYGPDSARFPRLEDEQCNAICSGDVNQLCGGTSKMAIFSSGLEEDYQIKHRYLGCSYRLQKDDYSLNDMYFDFPLTNRPSMCSRICKDFGYRFAGVRGITCLCGNRLMPNENFENGDSRECSITCAGNINETCGGYDGIQTYDLMKFITNGELSNTHGSIKLQEDFDLLDLKSRWSHEIYIPQEPNYEFVIYNNSIKNAFVKNGELIIKPTILPDEYVKKGVLTLKGCTKNEESVWCSKNATSFNILPPIVSVKLTTKNNIFFRYGSLEVIAKLPLGDWIVSEIALISKSNEQNKLVLASSFGNIDLKCNGADESAIILRYGLKIDEQYNLETNMKESSSDNTWSNDYHSFALSWTPENIIFKIDGKSHNLDAWNLPLNVILDAEFYLSIGVSVGGMTDFRDDCLSNGHLKPWKNFENKGMINFWKSKDKWLSTWNDEKSTLRVKTVKFTAMNNDS